MTEPTITTFEDLNLDKKILSALKDMGFEEPSPIQKGAIPLALEGDDIIGQAQTGTGKTAAFGIPIIQSIDEKNRHVPNTGTMHPGGRRNQQNWPAEACPCPACIWRTAD